MNTLKVSDIQVSNKSEQWRKLTSTKCQPSDTDVRNTPPYDVHPRGLKYRIHLTPSKSRPKLNCSGVIIDFCGVEACH